MNEYTIYEIEAEVVDTGYSFKVHTPPGRGKGWYVDRVNYYNREVSEGYYIYRLYQTVRREVLT